MELILILLLVAAGFIIRACSVNPHGGVNWFETQRESNRAARRRKS